MIRKKPPKLEAEKRAVPRKTIRIPFFRAHRLRRWTQIFSFFFFFFTEIWLLTNKCLFLRVVSLIAPCSLQHRDKCNL